jgi:hypothetical protein
MDVNELAQKIMARKEFKRATDGCYLSVYFVSRCYGGPEEGGWWYDDWNYQGSIRCIDERQAQDLKREMEQDPALEPVRNYEAYDALGDESNSSYPEGYIPTGWNDGGYYKVAIEFTAGINATHEAPRYE